MRTIVWFRGKDLRLTDHEALRFALSRGEVIPLFVLDPYFFGAKRAQKLPHRMQFLLESLMELKEEIAKRGSSLVLVEGRSVDVVPSLVEKWKADRVVAHRWVEPFARQRDRQIRDVLGDRFQLFEGETLMPPGSLRTQAGGPYSVFTQFHRTFVREARIERHLRAPVKIPSLPSDLKLPQTSIPSLESLGIVRNDQLLRGGAGWAKKRLLTFLAHQVDQYDTQRDRMDLSATSRLSADLKFGLISPREVYNCAQKKAGNTQGGQAFLRQLIWREFSYSSLWDRPELLSKPFRSTFSGFPWRTDRLEFQAWQEGRTGYPIVDAAARQLYQTGYVQNRARMVAASFLTKHLMIDYKWGESHYLKYLTDGDWAQNNAGWQWSAGCGCDAQPYFRVFNPTTQGKKFDAMGNYVRRWVPELAEVPTKYIHCPTLASDQVLKGAGVVLGQEYPLPIVDHIYARERFLSTATQYIKGISS